MMETAVKRKTKQCDEQTPRRAIDENEQKRKKERGKTILNFSQVQVPNFFPAEQRSTTMATSDPMAKPIITRHQQDF